MQLGFITLWFAFAVTVIISGSPAFAGPMQDAAITGDIEALQHLLETGSDPNSVVSEGSPTPLYFAADRGHADAVALLIAYGADVNALTFQGGALHIAARRGRLDIVTLLLDAGADPNLIGGERMRRPLHEAAYNGSIDVVTLLLDRGADVNGRTNYRGQEPAIHFAATRGHTEVVELLKERGFKPWTPDPITREEFASADLAMGEAQFEACAAYCHARKPGKIWYARGIALEYSRKAKSIGSRDGLFGCHEGHDRRLGLRGSQCLHCRCSGQPARYGRVLHHDKGSSEKDRLDRLPPYVV